MIGNSKLRSYLHYGTYILIIILIFIVGLKSYFPDVYYRVNSNQAFVVLTDSMDHVIKAKSMIIVDKSEMEYLVGDIITFRVDSVVEGKKTIVTHRLHDVSDGVYQTISEKGKLVDSWSLVEDDIIGKVTYIVPYLAHLVLALQSRAFLVLVSILILCLALIFYHLKYWSDL